jgi:hypothetical protein
MACAGAACLCTCTQSDKSVSATVLHRRMNRFVSTTSEATWRGPTRDGGASPFDAGRLRAVELRAGDAPALQRFFEGNPEYFFNATGQGPAEDEALQELHEVPPPDTAFGRQWLLGFVDETDGLVAMANCEEVLPARPISSDVREESREEVLSRLPALNEETSAVQALPS